MERDERVVVLGEDVGRNGGVFRVTEGLYEMFGPDRVIDTPLSEDGIVGLATGLALGGLKPVAEIQFADFIFPAFDQLVTELAKLRYRSGGQFSAPVVVRAPFGGGIRGGPYHSQSPETHFAHTAGLKVVAPSTPHDAKGLLKAAIRDEDPVIFFEPKRLYRTVKGEVPEGDYTVPLGVGRVAREGEDLTVACYGAMVPVCLEAAERAWKASGFRAEVLDLRSLLPLDLPLLLGSVEKTGRLVVAHEAPKTLGLGAEVAALVAEKALFALRAPVLRVAGYDTPFPFTHENLYMPGVERILQAIEHAMKF